MNGLVVASEANLANVPFADTDIVMMDMHTVSSYPVVEGMLTIEFLYNALPTDIFPGDGTTCSQGFGAGT